MQADISLPAQFTDLGPLYPQITPIPEPPKVPATPPFVLPLRFQPT